MTVLKLAALVTLGALVLSGCASVKPGDPLSLQKEPDQLCAPTKDVQNLYATARTVVSMKIAAEEARIKSGKTTCGGPMPVAEADKLRAEHATLRSLDFDLKRKIENPRSELDTAKIIRVLETLAKGIGALTEAEREAAVALLPYYLLPAPGGHTP